MEEKKVITIPISEVTPGMVSARDVYSKNDQLLVGRDSIVDANSIAKLTFFDILSMDIYQEDDLDEKEQIEEVHFDNPADQLVFEKFQENYEDAIFDMKESMNQLLTTGEDIDEKQLVDNVENIIITTNSKYQVFDMLHSIKCFDDETYNHCMNVSMLCNVFADWLDMSDYDKRMLTLCGLLHDFGKLLISKEILKKPGKLTDEEYEIIKAHPVKGYEYLKDKKLDDNIKQSVLSHHERCDGKGYPFGKKVNEINKFAAITAIADVYDAMTATRVYRTGLSPFRVIKLFEEEGRQQFNPVYLMPILYKLTDTYVRHKCLLSDGREGMIVIINSNELHKPIVQVGNEFVDLTKHRDLSIEKVF